MTDTAAKPQATKKRSKGPIRIEAILPLLVIGGGFYAYNTLLLDSHLRRGIEWAASEANGAEVNVGRVRTSLLRASLELRDIEVTDPEKPAQNRLSIQRVAASFSWDALLRAKLVARELALEGIGIDTPREAPGEVRSEPPQPAGGKSAEPEPSLSDAYAERFRESNLGQLVEMVSSGDYREQLQELGELASVKEIEALTQELKKSEATWDKLAQTAKRAAKVDDLKTRLEGVDLKSRKPEDLQKSATTLKTIIDDGKERAQSLKRETATTQKAIKDFAARTQGLEAIIAKDKQKLAAKLKIPRLDAETLSEELLGGAVASKVDGLRKYVRMAQRYAGSSKQDEADAGEDDAPHPRAEGKTFRFPRRGGYPALWIQKAVISSTPSGDGKLGALSGELVDVASDQRITGKPTVLTLKGSFPERKIDGIEVRAETDLRAKTPRHSVKLAIASYPIGATTLVHTKAVSLDLERATGALDADLELRGSRLGLTARSKLSNSEFGVKTSSKPVEKLITDALSRVPVISAEVKTGGEAGQFSLSSNVGKALADAFQAQLRDRIQAMRKKLETRLRDKVGAKQRELEKRFAAAQKRVEKQLTDQAAELRKVSQLAEDKLKQAEAELKKAVGQPAKKELKKGSKKLRKGLGF